MTLTIAEALARVTRPEIGVVLMEEPRNRMIRWRSWYDAIEQRYVLNGDVVMYDGISTGDRVIGLKPIWWWGAAKIVKTAEELPDVMAEITKELVRKILEI